MSQALRAPQRLRAVVVALVAVGAVAVVVSLSGGTGGSPALPAAARAVVGANPDVVTLHGDVLAMISTPDVQALAGLEQRLESDGTVAAQYGLTTWLSAQLAAIDGRARGRADRKDPLAAQLVRAGADGSISLADASLTSSLVFGTGETPVRSLRWLVPSARSARIYLRPAPGVALSALRRAIVGAVDGLDLPGITATVSGG